MPACKPLIEQTAAQAALVGKAEDAGMVRLPEVTSNWLKLPSTTAVKVASLLKLRPVAPPGTATVKHTVPISKGVVLICGVVAPAVPINAVLKLNTGSVEETLPS